MPLDEVQGCCARKRPARSRRPARRQAVAEVGSPCVSVCVMDPGLGYCIGCFRTLDEIADWINLDSAARLRVWDAIAERRSAQAIA